MDSDLGIDGIAQVRLLDSGGFADVYEAVDEFGRRVAIKVLKALDEATSRRFDRERSVMGMVAGHPHIVTPFTSGYTKTDGKPYVVMEYMGGGSLGQRIDRHGPLPVGEAIAMIEGVADALGASHRAGIIHKDVKPANILLTDDGTPKLADFGIASIRDVTTTTALAYSPAYTPPETFDANAAGDPRDERSDLYSLAATLYAIVRGHDPFLTGGESAAAAMVRILNDPPPQTGYAELDRFLAVAMAKDPAHRYRDAGEFIAALRLVGSGAVQGPSSLSDQPTQTALPVWPGGSSGPNPPTPAQPAPQPGIAQAGFSAGAPPQPGYPHAVASASSAPVDSVQTGGEGRRLGLVAGVVTVALALAAGAVFALTRVNADDTSAAGGEEPETSIDGGQSTTTDTAAEPVATEQPAPTLGEVGDLAGTSVAITGIESGDANIAGIEGALQVLSDQTGIEVTYRPAFSEELELDVVSGNPPDITMFAQPNVLAGYARSGDLKPVPSDVASGVSLVWNGEWTRHGEVDGVQYGVPNKTDPKSLVWYKPARFAELGYEVPGSWGELVALTEQAIADENTPWCVGIESAAATGWVFTDWVEDVMLRQHGAAAYDQWVAGEIPFSDPRVVQSFDDVRRLWTLPSSVHAANGSIVATPFSENAAPLVADDCLMHRQASFFSAYFPDGTPFADGSAGAVDVFYLPSEDENRPMVSNGSWAAAFADRPEVWVVMQYLGSPDYANARQAAQAAVTGPSVPSGFLTAVDGIDRNLFTPLENSMLDIVTVAGPVRYDASDAMPPEVGADSFWSAGTAFVAGDIAATEAAAAIDASWPR